MDDLVRTGYCKSRVGAVICIIIGFKLNRPIATCCLWSLLEFEIVGFFIECGEEYCEEPTALTSDSGWFNLFLCSWKHLNVNTPRHHYHHKSAHIDCTLLMSTTGCCFLSGMMALVC